MKHTDHIYLDMYMLEDLRKLSNLLIRCQLKIVELNQPITLNLFDKVVNLLKSFQIKDLKTDLFIGINFFTNLMVN